MPDDDATLDDFLGTGESDGEEVESDSEEADTDPVEPATSTYAWSPEGGVCEACGDRVETRWRDDGALVCAECKEW